MEGTHRSYKDLVSTIAIGQKVLSFPNRKGIMLEGKVTELSTSTVTVEYTDYGVYTLNLVDGRLFNDKDTSVDICLLVPVDTY